jgi:Stage II sporulation protein E (SpoIIE)
MSTARTAATGETVPPATVDQNDPSRLCESSSPTSARGSEQFGEARLSSLLRNQVGADPESVATLIEDAVLAFQGGHAADDFCVIALRVTGNAAALA